MDEVRGEREHAAGVKDVEDRKSWKQLIRGGDP